MKKLVVLILCLAIALSLACADRPQDVAGQSDPIAVVTENTPEPAVDAAEETPAPSAESIMDIPIGMTGSPSEEMTPEPVQPSDTPEPTPYQPDLTMLPMAYRVDWEMTEATMFTCDIDYDGEQETISYRFDEKNEIAYILVDDAEMKFTQCSDLNHVILVDLDPETPWVNLLVVCDSGSDDYTTTEVHPENGTLVRGIEKEFVSLDGDGRLVSYERTDLLGTREGKRYVHGERLEPDSEWLTVYTPSEEDLKDKEARKSLIEVGTLLHAKRAINCRINGEPAKIKKGTYLYMTRFHESRMLVEVKTEDGTTALIAVDCDPDAYGYYIGGREQGKVFDNIFYAD